jgi:ribosomal protein S18 acetylase RimI-like enzyme
MVRGCEWRNTSMLLTKQLQDIKTLQQEVEDYDHINLKLNWEMLETRPHNETNDYFYYEDQKLVAFLGIYRFGNKAEICGMVRPSKRRNGYAGKLLNEALMQLKSSGIQTVLLNIPSNSTSGHRFAKNQPVTYSFSEHQMKWNSHIRSKSVRDDVVIKEAQAGDLEYIIQMDAQGFGMSESEARTMYSSGAEKGHYIVYANNVRAGKLRVIVDDKASWIYGFVVTPSMQGKGIGQAVLVRLIQQEAAKGQDVLLEVALENAHALKLYTSVGFDQFSTQDYYTFSE